MHRELWKGRRVLVTGHTGFKGAWMCQWLKAAGATVTGFAVDVPTSPSLFELASVADGMTDLRGDVNDREALERALTGSQAEVVIHMAAQALVRPSYDDPVLTYATNVMGTVHLLDGVRRTPSVRAVVIVTSDKCYENREWVWPYRESEAMGGHDPYSSSKACAELVTSAYRRSFFAAADAPGIASVRAGNVIGGGDWAKDRLVPDLLRAFAEGSPAVIRNPLAVRPWQFVLEPVSGYLAVAEALLDGNAEAADAWNFGPADADVRPVSWIADRVVEFWGSDAKWVLDEGAHPHEARSLRLDSSRARARLGWEPRLDLPTALAWTVEWHRVYTNDPGRIGAVTSDQISRYESLTA